MQHALNLKYAEPDVANDIAPDATAQLRWQLLEAEPGSKEARHLQHLLFEAYAEKAADEKLQGSQRLAIIVGATAALWILIAAAAMALF